MLGVDANGVAANVRGKAAHCVREEVHGGAEHGTGGGMSCRAARGLVANVRGWVKHGKWAEVQGGACLDRARNGSKKGRRVMHGTGVTFAAEPRTERR